VAAADDCARRIADVLSGITTSYAPGLEVSEFSVDEIGADSTVS
jgi:hypothetical protein